MDVTSRIYWAVRILLSQCWRNSTELNTITLLKNCDPHNLHWTALHDKRLAVSCAGDGNDSNLKEIKRGQFVKKTQTLAGDPRPYQPRLYSRMCKKKKFPEAALSRRDKDETSAVKGINSWSVKNRTSKSRSWLPWRRLHSNRVKTLHSGSGHVFFSLFFYYLKRGPNLVW